MLSTSTTLLILCASVFILLATSQAQETAPSSSIATLLATARFDEYRYTRYPGTTILLFSNAASENYFLGKR
jgi:hypothetical protein